MKHNIINSLLAFACLCLCSCVVPDPAYYRESKAVQDVEYPPNKIVGQWFDMLYLPFATDRMNLEVKHTYDIRPGGTGIHRQFTENLVNDHCLAVEAPLTWSYLGKNRWQINFSRSGQYRVTRKKGTMGVSHDKAIPPSIVRYANGKLFEPAQKHIWLPISNQAAMKAQVARMRAARSSNQMYINTQP